MSPAEFKKKWSRYQGKETSAYQEYFTDLCRLIGQPTPNEADPSGTDFFCYQKHVVKDAELFNLDTPDASEPNERGFADVWKKGCFAWEYKGKKKNLDEAYKQLLRYRESLLNPPEWTVEKILEFPGSIGSAWKRFLDAKKVDAKTGIGTVRYPHLEPRDTECTAKLKKRTLTNLYNERTAWLDLAHTKLDTAVAAAYGWRPDLSDEQILEKLLELNLERAAEESKAAKVKQPKAQREKRVDELV